MATDGADGVRRGVVVVGGDHHNFDLPRQFILDHLAQGGAVRAQCTDQLEARHLAGDVSFVISYTCNTVPDLATQEALADFVSGGGRWFALHATNAIVRTTSEGRRSTPRWAPKFMETLGSTFLAHPPFGPFTVHVEDATHPLTSGLDDFEIEDEFLVLETYGELEVLLSAELNGDTSRFLESPPPRARHPLAYVRRQGAGEVYYLALGHSPRISRAGPIAWSSDIYRELVRRGLDWATRA
jgi:type 1 glutamine amidotransferase